MDHTIDDKLERLVVRVLDGAATPAEQAELNAHRSTNPAVQALFDEYAAIDANARLSLQAVIVRTEPAMAPAAHSTAGLRRVGRRRTTTFLRVLGGLGITAVAAVIGFMASPAATRSPSAPRAWSDLPRVPDLAQVPRPADSTAFVSDEAVDRDEAWRRLMPHRDFSEVRQSWIGVYDNDTQRMYLLGVDRREVRSVPVIYEN